MASFCGWGMGNLSSSLFATPQEKEIRKLTKKNTKANRVSLGSNYEGAEDASGARKENRRGRESLQPLRFENFTTEVTYDLEEGEVEVSRGMLNHESEDALGSDLIAFLVPTQVPVVSKDEQDGPASSPMAGPDPQRRAGALKRNSSFITAHAARRTGEDRANVADWSRSSAGVHRTSAQQS